MPVYFVFSDESGKYKKERNDKFIQKNPFYCRSAVFLEVSDWIKLRKRFAALKKALLECDLSREVKWSSIWSLFKHRQKGEEITKEMPYFFLRNHSLDKLIEFIGKALHLLHESESSRIVLTLTFNERQKTKPTETKELLKMHLAHILNMAEKEMRKRARSVCIFFFNPEEPPLERYFREAFREIFRKPSSSQYGHIKDSLSFEYFLHSFGSQLADYCAGVFYGSLRLYPQSIELIRSKIWPKILKEKDKALGFGISEIPKNQKNREHLEGIIGKIFEAKISENEMNLETRLKKREAL